MNDREQIKKHYNQISNKTPDERKSTANINIRNVNNFIKSCLIKEYMLPYCTVLDIGVGKGGDFKKYQAAKVSEVYGLDVANRSILDALERARSSGGLCFKLVLKVKDCFTSKFDLKKEFDFISIQFSFHYCFAKEEYVNITLDNIYRHLKPNGCVIITTPFKEEILKRKAEGRLSNKYYSIKFRQDDIKGTYGDAYSYTLVDSLDDCVEYLVDSKELIDKAAEKGLHIVLNQSFKEYYESRALLYTDLYNRMVPNELNNEELEVVNLHKIFVFKKAWV